MGDWAPGSSVEHSLAITGTRLLNIYGTLGHEETLYMYVTGL